MVFGQAVVYGRDPVSEAGMQFEACTWHWRTLLELILIADHRRGGCLIDDDTFVGMHYCAGTGLESQEDCDALAVELQAMISRPALITEHGLELAEDNGEPIIYIPASKLGMLMDEQGRLYSTARVKEAEIAKLKLISAYFIPVAKVREYIGFLKACNGFCVR